jgi:hypothetical protein
LLDAQPQTLQWTADERTSQAIERQAKLMGMTQRGSIPLTRSKPLPALIHER